MTYSYFENNGESVATSYNNGIANRGRNSIGILFTKNYAVVFDGESIEGLCVVQDSSFDKMGKWSSTTFQLILAPGVKFVAFHQNFDTGVFISDFTTLKTMRSNLRLDELNMSAFKDFLAVSFPSDLAKFHSNMEAIHILEETADCDAVEYNFSETHVSRRLGSTKLLVDGELWDETTNPMTDKVVVVSSDYLGGRGSGTTNYKLMILSTCTTDETTFGEWEEEKFAGLFG